jgi:hypothetical protein
MWLWSHEFHQGAVAARFVWSQVTATVHPRVHRNCTFWFVSRYYPLPCRRFLVGSRAQRKVLILVLRKVRRYGWQEEVVKGKDEGKVRAQGYL